MEKDIFVNDGFTFAINQYLDNKSNPEGVDYNSFFAVVIRLMILIYDELDILNPYYLKDETLLDSNLKKYGYSYEDISKFKIAIDDYYKNESEDGFIFIQKELINMFMKKKIVLDIKDEELNTFKALLYSPYSPSPLMVSYNFYMTKKPNEVLDYFETECVKNIKKEIVKPKETLNLEAYEILKYSIEDIKNMSSDELNKVNKEVYNYFDINENAINKNYQLDKKVYEYNHPKPALSTGNGFVDILFILSIIATVGLVILVFTILLF